jgi:hypothetical protein
VVSILWPRSGVARRLMLERSSSWRNSALIGYWHDVKRTSGEYLDDSDRQTKLMKT